MRVLAVYVMKGQSQAIIAAVSLSLLAFFVSPLGILSGAIVALVTLRDGEKAGLMVGAAVAISTGLAAALVFNVPLWSFALTLMGWLPLWLLASFLKHFRSLSLTVAVGLVFGLVVLVLLFLMNADQAAFWKALLQPFVEAFNQQNNAVSEIDKTQMLSVLSRWAAAGFASGYYLQLMLTLFVARWWQALLYNPGGFREEFHSLRLPPWVALVAAAALAIFVSTGSLFGLWFAYLFVLFSSALFLQGLAVMHGLVGRTGVHVGWLIAAYVLLFIALPQMVGLLALIGLADQFLNIRARFSGTGPET